MDALRPPDERPERGRRSRVVLMPRRWHQVGGAIRQRWWQESPITRESAKETVKTNRAGNAGVVVRTCGDLGLCAFLICTQGCGCVLRIRLFLRPLASEGHYSHKPRAKPAARTRRCVLCVISGVVRFRGTNSGMQPATAGDSLASGLHYPREAASCVRSHISPGPYRSFRELSLTGSVDPDIWCPPTFVGNSGIERSNGDRGFALFSFAE